MIEKFNRLGKEKKILVFVFIFIITSLTALAVVMESETAMYANGNALPSFDSDAPVEYSELSSEESEDGLKAIVKGSIYEKGDNMTVYGACFDNRGNLFPEANATFTSWYPNGTILNGPNASMIPITEDWTGSNPNGTGRWKIHVTMNDTLGTYLTEMRCNYNNQNAVAFGEWQNPAWVKRIRTTQNQLINASNVLDQFRNETNNNISQILSQLSSTDAQDTQQIRELADSVRDIDKNAWVIDEDNPFYVLDSGQYNLKAVDMISDDSISAAASDGYFVSWDGETWTDQASNNSYRGVSSLAANQPYAWAVGSDNASNPIIAVNGGSSPSNPPPNGTATAYNDVKLFQDPSNPAGNYYAYVLANDGALYMSNDSASTWTNIASLDPAETGRISQVVENYGSSAQPNGYMTLIGQGDTIVADDGVTPQTFNTTGQVKDTALLYYDYGYAVTKTNTTLYIYKWNGNNFTEEFSIDDADITPVAVDIHSKDDVWVATNDPSSFLHFNGRSWKISKVGYSEFVSVLINFNGNASNDTGIQDMRMVDSRHGYAVGGDGLILEYQSEAQRNFETLQQQIDNINASFTADINTTELALKAQVQNLSNLTQEEFDNITAYLTQRFDENDALIQALNATMQQEFNDIDSFLVAFNNSLQQRFTDVDQAISLLNQTMNGRFDNVSQRFDNVDAAIASMNSSLHLQHTQTQTLITNINQSLSQGQTDIETLIQAVNASLDARINQSFNDVENTVLAINSSINTNIDETQSQLSSMNATLNVKLDNIVSNVTFTNQYLQTTIYPRLNATYQNTLQILTELGIIQGQLNTTIDITNETRSIVNESAQDIDVLRNRSDQDEERIEAWITQ